MAGLTFFKTEHLDRTQAFYTDLGMTTWLDQGDCMILRHGNLLLGFCAREGVDSQGTITFFYDTREEVDALYRQLGSVAAGAPRENERYRIYHFFAQDPDGRTLEFQSFLHPLPPYLTGDALLRMRRSVRAYKPEPVPDEVLWDVFELCRYAPTSKNSQSCSFVVIRERETLDFLGGVRGGSAPIARAPMAVAISADPAKTLRPEQDGCIAAYHFLLAATLHGLGTCWIAAMDRDDVKEHLGIPLDHVIATVTPVGYPAEYPSMPGRREARDMVRWETSP